MSSALSRKTTEVILSGVCVSVSSIVTLFSEQGRILGSYVVALASASASMSVLAYVQASA